MNNMRTNTYNPQKAAYACTYTPPHLLTSAAAEALLARRGAIRHIRCIIYRHIYTHTYTHTNNWISQQQPWPDNPICNVHRIIYTHV